MSLLKKRRSQSETRTINQNNDGQINFTRAMDKGQQILESYSMDRNNGQLGPRRTSTEMINEAKNFLNDNSKNMKISAVKNNNQQHTAVVGGVKIFNTRRPVTPRDQGRVLYGKVHLPGHRPPSAVSMRYLQKVSYNSSSGEDGAAAGEEGAEKHNNQKHKGIKLTKHILSCESDEGLEHGGGSTVAQQKQQQQPANEQNGVVVGNSIFNCHPRSRNSNFTRSNNKNANNSDIRETIGEELTKISSQLSSKHQFPRKLPALEVKGIEYFKDSTKDLERAKTACVDLNAKLGTDGIPFLGSGGSNKTNRALKFLTTNTISTRTNDLLGQSSTEKLIEMLKEHAGLKECTEETVNHINSILMELYRRVRINEKHFKKGFILGGIYGLVECTSPKILLAVARVVLALRVSGSNLTGACKLIFKVARNEQNDHLFHDNDLLELLIDGLGRASPLEDPEACIYGYGAIRFLTCSSVQEREELTAIKDFNSNWSPGNAELPLKPNTAPSLGDASKNNALRMLLQEKFMSKVSKQDALVVLLARNGAVQLMILHLQILNETGAARKLTGPPLHSLYQLSAALRALADVRKISSTSIEHLENNNAATTTQQVGDTSIQLELACPHLIKAAEVAIGEIEVQANIVRTLSVLSEDPDCCNALVNFAGRIGMLLGPCCANFSVNTAEKHLALVSRLGYILGNIMAKHDNARLQFYHNDVAMEYLLNILKIYSAEPLTLQNSMGDTVIDVLIKMIRVVANMSVNSEVGFGMGSTHSLGQIILELLKTAQEIKLIKIKDEMQELLHVCLGALHNLCFYQDKMEHDPGVQIEQNGSLQTVIADMTMQLTTILKTAKEEIIQIEVSRVLGNLTRNDIARKFFCQANGLHLILYILNHPSTQQLYDLKACTLGVLVNLMGDNENRLPLIQLKGAEILVHLLKNTLNQYQDWFLATIICQAFWNLLIDIPKLEDVCTVATLDELSDLLAEYLDDERIKQMSLNDQCSNQLWDNFAIVATDLLERLQANYEYQDDEELFSLDESSDIENDEDDIYIEGGSH